ncbi:MAG: MotA/TolQ/ExbB proton channel family protein [Myxococcota bacterium]
MAAPTAGASKLDMSPEGLWNSMGTMARVITVFLLIMAVASLTVFIERLYVYLRTRSRSREFALASGNALDRRSYDEVQLLAKKHEGSMLAEMVGGSLEVFTKAVKDVAAGVRNHLPPVELARRELARRLEAHAAKLRRGLPILASVSSVAPFVGLFGTVVGIITAFEGIGNEGSGGLGAVSAGIAEALAVTGVGLGVAIPAVLGFNFLQTLAERIELALATAASELGDHLENSHGSGDGGGGHGPAHSGLPSDEHLKIPSVEVGSISPAGSVT